jgi:hypothetical protein
VIANPEGAKMTGVADYVREKLSPCLRRFVARSWRRLRRAVGRQFDNMKEGEGDFFAAKEMVLAVGALLFLSQKTRRWSSPI